jgi:segregation and condensation protein B
MEDQEIPAAAAQPEAESLPETPEAVTPEDLLGALEPPRDEQAVRAAELKGILEAVIYVLNEPIPAAQIAQALGRPLNEVRPLLEELVVDSARPERGLLIREVAGGYQMGTKPEHHDTIRQFVKNLKQPLKLSQAALETLAVIAYKQPITLPEILEIRGVQGGGVLKTLIDRKLITVAGRKNVIGRPMLYKTTKDFLTQFGLKDLAELPSLREFEEIRRQSMADDVIAEPTPEPPPEPQPEPEPEPESPPEAEAESDG